MLFAFEVLIAVYLFITGSCIGSFLNVVAWRAPRGLSPARGRSFCPGCKRPIASYDLIPVVSFLVLRGKCRHCGSPIPKRDFAVELLMGLCPIAVVARFGFTWAALLAFVFLCLLLLVALIDWDFMIIPNQLVIGLSVVAVLSLLTWEIPMTKRIMGALCVSLPMLMMDLFVPEAFGGGDIKLMLPCGFLLGLSGTLLAGFLGVVSCGTVALVWMAQKKLGKGAHIAFGPFLAMGCAVALLWGGPIVSWYLSLSGL